MSSRERGSLWPVVLVAGGTFLLLVIVPLIVQRQKNSEMATVEAQVNIGDYGASTRREGNAPSYRWPDSEVPRTAERLRDTTAVAIAATSSVIEGSLTGHIPRNCEELTAHMVQRQFIPSDWISQRPEVLQAPRGTIHLRYLPAQLALEVISVPADRNGGPAILIRLPDGENTGVGARYFESMQLDGIVYPPPFAPIAEIIASGWQPRLFKQTQIPDEQRAQLEQWTSRVNRK